MKNNMEENNPQEVPMQPMSTKMKVLLVVMGVVIVVLGVGLVWLWRENANLSEEVKSVALTTKETQASDVCSEEGNLVLEKKVEVCSDGDSESVRRIFAPGTDLLYAKFADSESEYDIYSLGSSGRAMRIETGIQTFGYDSTSTIFKLTSESNVFVVSNSYGDAGASFETKRFFKPNKIGVYNKVYSVSKLANFHENTIEIESKINYRKKYKISFAFDKKLTCSQETVVENSILGLTIDEENTYYFEEPILVSVDIPYIEGGCAISPYLNVSYVGVNKNLDKMFFDLVELENVRMSFSLNLETGEVTQEEPTELLEIIEE